MFNEKNESRPVGRIQKDGGRNLEAGARTVGPPREGPDFARCNTGRIADLKHIIADYDKILAALEQRELLDD
jgi:hypothetical protein